MQHFGFDEMPVERFERFDIVGHQLNRHLVAQALTGTSGIIIDHITFPPGFVHKMHRHPHADQFMVPLSGRLLVESVGLESTELGVGQIIVLPKNTWHEVKNTGETDCVCIHVFSNVDAIGEIGFEPYEGGAS